MLKELLNETVSVLAFSGVGIVLMVLGFVLVDVITPGNLRKQIWLERNRNATVLLASNLLAVGMIVFAAISASSDNLVVGISYSFVYGVIGLIVMGVAFVLLDLLTPGKLGAILVEENNHPAVWVTAATHIAVALVVMAGLS
ncbi:DUF350 domain-containing protein [Stackebrandtia nassauensis]|uniref:DUF350 domain-containing protein n=1 Tax=Stackebrandtia nassauensis (strain DSM 44728 / CIP 108903 / NRRL B-16338 / NBRC 102104 / LLR-40K-21) TaxID=446470 RepID=D3Q8W7_STANL|nr:DUF350 domain-containing protein [Stackebrandtia nassauensis]ADD40576.1 protein of unknown function DUF350 [Stackebrandtia nassauensis DSM 44728]